MRHLQQCPVQFNISIKQSQIIWGRIETKKSSSYNVNLFYFFVFVFVCFILITICIIQVTQQSQTSIQKSKLSPNKGLIFKHNLEFFQTTLHYMEIHLFYILNPISQQCSKIFPPYFFHLQEEFSTICKQNRTLLLCITTLLNTDKTLYHCLVCS